MALCSISPKDDIITVAQFHLQVSSLSKLILELALEVVRALYRKPDNKQNRCRTGEECEWEKLEERFLISVRVMCSVSSSFMIFLFIIKLIVVE